MHPKCFSKYFFCNLFPLATPQVTFRALAKPRIWRAASYSPPAWLSSNHLPPRFIILFICSSPVPDPIPDPVPPHISCFQYLSCFMFPAPIPVPNPEPRTPNPEPRSILLRIMSPCSFFVPMFFCPNPCPFPSTLLYSFRYLYVDNFLYVPQSEIDIDCPL